MTAQQIADVLDVDLNRLKENREAMTDFYAASGDWRTNSFIVGVGYKF
ncbi:Ail/Lom family outer membrane beta-barrel protein [Escherichia coli]|nr:Ail/Lom family outer membrane beta-barrel protein [Escherichia coli]